MKSKVRNVLIAVIVASILLIGFLTLSPIYAVEEPETTIEITEGKYDAYTNTDTFKIDGFPIPYNISNYGSLKGKYATYSKSGSDISLSITKDDPIVSIVPKELFEKSGNYLYIGREYGFYVNTFSDPNGKNKHSFAMVFDIVNNLNVNSNDGLVNFLVMPLYQFEYAFLVPEQSQFQISEQSNVWAYSFDYAVNYSVSGGCVVPVPRDVRVKGVVGRSLS